MSNQHTEIELPQSYTFVGDGQAMTVAQPDSVLTAGQVSRYERQVIVPGGPDGEMSPSAQNFDGIMDYLETLMAPQIEENNRMAAQQAAAYPL